MDMSHEGFRRYECFKITDIIPASEIVNVETTRYMVNRNQRCSASLDSTVRFVWASLIPAKHLTVLYNSAEEVEIIKYA